LYSDLRLNGAGWHIHKSGGKLNTHLDYSIHPKLGMQRKLNLIIYLSREWDTNWGGLGLWGNDTPNEPGPLIKTIDFKFNRAVIFDTTQNSWHGLPDQITCPPNFFRRSIALYYLCTPSIDAIPRGKALFSPSEMQCGNKEIEELIILRSSQGGAAVYRTKII